MVFVCCVPGCKNKVFKKKANPSLSFHRFPCDPVLKEAWLQACGKHNWTPQSSRIVLCSKHFREEDFNRTYASGVVKLREGVVPSIFPKIEPGSNLQQGRKLARQKNKVGRKRMLNKLKAEAVVVLDKSEVHNSHLSGRNGTEGRIRKKTWKLREEEEMSELHSLEKIQPKVKRKYVKRSVVESENSGSDTKETKQGIVNSPRKRRMRSTDIAAGISPQRQENSKRRSTEESAIGLIQPVPTSSLLLSTLPSSSAPVDRKVGEENTGVNVGGAPLTPGVGVIPTVFPPLFQPIPNQLFFLVVPQDGGGSNAATTNAAASVEGSGTTSGLVAIAGAPTVSAPVIVTAAVQNHEGIKTQAEICPQPHHKNDDDKIVLEHTLKLKKLTVELAEARMRRKLLIQSIRRIKKKKEKLSSRKPSNGEDAKSDGQLADTLKEKMLVFELSQEINRIMELLGKRRKLKKQGLKMVAQGLVTGESDLSEGVAEFTRPRIGTRTRGRRRGSGSARGGQLRRILPKLEPTLSPDKLDKILECSLTEDNDLEDDTNEKASDEAQSHEEYKDVSPQDPSEVTEHQAIEVDKGGTAKDEASIRADSPMEKTDGKDCNPEPDIPVRSMTCPEVGCDTQTGSYKSLRDHLTSAHAVDLEPHTVHKFKTHEELLRWKSDIEESASCTYTSDLEKDGSEVEVSEPRLRSYFCRTASGETSCPSTIEVTAETTTEVTAFHFPTHRGHPAQVKETASKENGKFHYSFEDDIDDDPGEVESYDTELEIYTDEVIIPGEGEVEAEVEEDQTETKLEDEKENLEDEEEDSEDELEWSQSSRLRRVNNTIIYPSVKDMSSEGGTFGGIKPALVTDPVKERVLLTLKTAEEMVLKMSGLTPAKGEEIVGQLLRVLDQLTDGYDDRPGETQDEEEAQEPAETQDSKSPEYATRSRKLLS